jgi:UPF0755 protein
MYDYESYARTIVKRRLRLVVLFFVLVIGYIYFFQLRAPSDFVPNTIVSVANGKSMTEIAHDLERQNIIRSPFWFGNFVLYFKQERSVVGGEYLFEKPANVFEVAKRLTEGAFATKQIKTTIPEGSTVYDISNILLKNYPNFDTSRFITLAQPKEGYLFPDTYYFGAGVQPEKVIEVMTTTFNKKIQDPELQEIITDFGKPFDEVLIMASILEAEARLMRTRQIVAGILWQRIKLGIPLQVDAGFKYVNGKGSADLTLDDLKIDSPYNTYLNKGLPPTPIANPGLDSIKAAATPIQTEYLYFLTDEHGKMHYGRTLEEHARNKELYLR